jgi:hypothetical protein
MSKSLAPWLMLLSRSAFFLAIQLLIALGFFSAGNDHAFRESARWWPFFAIGANLTSLYLLVRLFRAEGRNFWDILKFRRETWKTDLLWLLGSSVVGLPIAAAPMYILGPWLYGDTTSAARALFQPLPGWALALAFLFPLTIWFAELPTYFGYAMPRLAAQLGGAEGKRSAVWAAWLLASLFLAFQHVFLPFQPDLRFILYRALMYLPFALFAGIMLKFRPSLLPYMAIVHALMDISAVSVYWMV